MELHRAHRALVRRYHPDAVHPDDESGRVEAEARIREVNQAWQELRDPLRRARYDRTLEPEPRPSGLTAGPPPAPAGGSTGSGDWFADADLRRSTARVATRSPRPVKPFRVRVLFGFGILVLVGILVVVFLTGESTEGPGSGIGRGSCVRINNMGPPTQVPCELPNDGRVLSQVDVAGECPNGASARQLSAGDTRLTCLEP